LTLSIKPLKIARAPAFNSELLLDSVLRPVESSVAPVARVAAPVFNSAAPDCSVLMPERREFMPLFSSDEPAMIWLRPAERSLIELIILSMELSRVVSRSAMILLVASE